MPNANQIIFIIIITIIFLLSLIGLYYVLNKASNRRRELFDLEQRLQAQEQLSIQYLASAAVTQQQPAATMIKQSHVAPLVIMTPKKQELPTNKQKSKRESILNKVYGFRTGSTSPPLYSSSPQRPSSIRPPSFLPMQEKHRSLSPPAYGDYRNSIPVKVKTTSDSMMSEK